MRNDFRYKLYFNNEIIGAYNYIKAVKNKMKELKVIETIDINFTELLKKMQENNYKLKIKKI